MRLALRGLTLSGSSRRRINLPPAIQDGSGVAVLVTAVLAAGLVLSSASVSAAASTAAAGQVRGGASVAAAGMIAADGRPPTQAGVAAVPAVSAAGLVAGEAEVTAAPDVIAGSEEPSSYESFVLALGPAGYWRLNHAVGQTATATVGSNGSYQGTPEIVLLPLVANAETGACSGFDETHWLSLTTPISSANFTIDCALQLDRHKSKHVIITTGGGSVSGQFSVELVDDGAGGLQARVWSRPPSGGLHTLRSPAGSVPIGVAFKLSYRRNANGTQSVLINGVEQVLTTEAGTAGVAWDPPPAGTVFVGRWSNGDDPLDGVMAELAVWDRAVPTSDLLALVQAQNIVWLPLTHDAGSVSTSASKAIDIGALAHPATGITVSRVTPNPTRGSTSISGVTVTYTAGSTAGDNDTFGVQISRGGLISQAMTVTIDVQAVDVQTGENPNLPYFGRWYGAGMIGFGVGDYGLNRGDTHGTAIFFWADRSEIITHWRMQIRYFNPSSYSEGDGGVYTVEIRDADPNTRFPLTNGAVLSRRTGWNPRVLYGLDLNAGGQYFTEIEFTEKIASAVAKKPYCLVFRNTHSSPGGNFVSINCDHVSQGGAPAQGMGIGDWYPQRLHMPNGSVVPFWPIPSGSKSSGMSTNRFGPWLLGFRYASGIWAGWNTWGSGHGESQSRHAISTTSQLRERFRVTRADRLVDEVWIHIHRLNNASGTVFVTLEEGPASDTSGNGTVIEERTISHPAIKDVGSAYNDGEEIVHYVRVPFSQPRLLRKGSIYNLRVRASNSGFEMKISRREEAQDLSPEASLWEEYEQIRKVSWTGFEDSRGVNFTTNGGSTWARTSKQAGIIFRCVI